MRSKVSKIFIIFFIFLFFYFIIFNVNAGNNLNLQLAEVNSTMYVNINIINEYIAKVDLIHYYSINDTFLKNNQNIDSSYKKVIPLGITITLKNSAFIKWNETKIETNFGDLKIFSINETKLISEELDFTLGLNDSIYYKLTCYLTGFAFGIPEINLYRIPSIFSLINNNVSNQELNIKFELPFKSSIDINDKKYISFFGYRLEDLKEFNEKFIDEMLSGNPLIVSFNKKQIGTELSLFPYIDYYISDVPNIILKYEHEYDIINNRLQENIMIKNRKNYSLHFAKKYNESGLCYSLIDEDEIENYDETYLIPPTSGSYYDFDFIEEEIDFNKRDISIFGLGQHSFPFESYEIKDSKIMRINFDSKEPITFIVNFNLNAKKMNLFDFNIKKSYYKLSPTCIRIPPLFDETNKLIHPGEDVKISDFEEDVNGARILLDIVPKEFNKDINKSIYRLYSTWFTAETHKINNNNYPDFVSFDDTNFEISISQKEITIYYHFIYSTKNYLIFIWLLYLIFTPFSIFLINRYYYRKKRNRYFSIMASFGILITYIPQRPYGFTLTLFDIIGLEIIIIVFGFILHWKLTIKVCPKCGKSSKVYLRKTMTPKYRCYNCDSVFD